MLPLLRVLPVGGVLLAILLLLMALNPPGSPPSRLSGHVIGAGPLLDGGEHPEWRQFRMRAALRRAHELEQLRNLPGVDIRAVPPTTGALPAVPPVKEATLPTTREEIDPTQGVPDAPVPDDVGTIPVGLGEASSAELPLIPADPTPPVIRLIVPRPKPAHETKRRVVRHRQVRVQPPTDPNNSFNFSGLFGPYVPEAPSLSK